MLKLLIVISGPSGVGKRCVMEGVELYCRLGLLKCAYNKIVLYNTREKRGNEHDGVDYHYCYGEFAAKGESSLILSNKGLIANDKSSANRLISPEIRNTAGELFTFPVRGDLQGIDLKDIEEGVNFLEIYDQFFTNLESVLAPRSIRIIRLFISPFTKNEMIERALQGREDEAAVIKSEMKERIQGRKRLGLSNEDEAEIIKRTDSAVEEIQAAFTVNNPYDAIVVNPCGEAHPSWGTSNTMPIADARITVDTLCRIIAAQL